MGKRLSTKHRKMARDKATAYKKGELPRRRRKSSLRTAKQALKRKAYPMT